MPSPKTTTSFADDITVTTATRTAEEVRASLGVTEEKPATSEVPAESGAAATATDADAPESEGRSQEVTDAARVLREQRLGERKARLSDENATYEDTITRLGGTVPALEKREYPTKQAELDALTKRRYELSKLTNTLLKQQANRPAARAAAPPAAPQPGAAPAGDDKPTLPTFAFPTWDEWQLKHPDKDYTDYTDARSDQRDHWKATCARITQQHTDQRQAREAATHAEREAVAQHDTALATFKADHPDYDELTEHVSLAALGPERLDAFRWAMLREGAGAPAILYYLAHHPEEIPRVAQTRNLAEFFAVMGEVRYAAKVASPTIPSAARPAGAAASASAAGAAGASVPAPSQPKPGAPAPLAAVPGSTSHRRTTAQIAEDSEDADAYIAARQADLRPSRRAS